jgi:Raf kinase inhibitor-like YbhB/YbcL family protein
MLVGGTTLRSADSERLAWNRLFATVPVQIDVEADAFANGQTMPLRCTGEGDNLSPGLRWINCPRRTRSLTILCENPDGTVSDPIVHWLAYNIPAHCRAVPENIEARAVVASPLFLLQGMNSMNTIGYSGPVPSGGSGVHRYFFQVYALDSMLPLEGGKNCDEVFAAMRDRVLAKGMTIGTFAG